MSGGREELEADVVVVGTGAGGATAARVLSEAGLSVAMLEEGPWLRAEERPRELLGAMTTALRAMATQTTRGAAPMPLLQGSCVGGSTAVNSGIIWRMPDDVRRAWRDDYGLGALVDAGPLDEAFAQIEDELEIGVTPAEVLGGNARLMALASERLGLPGQPTTRNARRCRGRGDCLQGCPGEARTSMDVSYVPTALRLGATLHPNTRVERLSIERGRAVGVVGTTRVAGNSRRLVARARRAVVVAAGALHTPLLLRRAGVGGPVGRRFQAHPGVALVGRFSEPVGMGFGATQAYEVPMRARGFKLESLSLPPEMLATRLPGAGAEFEERLRALDHYAQWVVQVRMEAHGTVSAGFGGGVAVRYSPTERDMRRVTEALLLLCRMMFAAGAVEVYPAVARWPSVVRSRDELPALEAAGVLTPRDVHLVASHLFGTATAGADPTASVLAPSLECHRVRGLYVADASAFPTNLGVNPQHSIMGVVHVAMRRLAASATRSRTAA